MLRSGWEFSSSPLSALRTPLRPLKKTTMSIVMNATYANLRVFERVITLVIVSKHTTLLRGNVVQRSRKNIAAIQLTYD